MKKINALTIQALKEELYIALMLFIYNALADYEVISEMFEFFVNKFNAAYDHLNSVFKKYDYAFCTQKVREADEKRSKKFRELRERIRWFTLFSDDAAKIGVADILLKVIDKYGGANIANKGINAKTTAITNLVEDFEDIYPTEVETLGIGELVSELKQAQNVFNHEYFNRAECDSEVSKGAFADARKRMDEAYRDLVAAINLQAKEDSEGKLTPFINLMNVEVGKYRVYTGQGQVGSSSTGSNGSDSEEDETVRTKTATFKFKNGTTVSFKVEVGAILEAPANTPGYEWKPKVPEFMPTTNKTFREVAIEPEKFTALFHFADHREEEIREVVGAILHAPANTTGYIWVPAVPETMPAENTTYNEMPEEEQGGAGTGGNGTGTGGEHEGMFKAEYFVGENLVATQWYYPGDRIVEPEGLLPDGWIWGNTPNVMPDRDVKIYAVEDE